MCAYTTAFSKLTISSEGLILDLINNLVWHTEVLDSITPDVGFGHPPEAVTVLGRADDLPQVHMCSAIKSAVESAVKSAVRSPAYQ